MFTMFCIGFLIGGGLIAVLACLREKVTWSTVAILLLLLAILSGQWAISSADANAWAQYRAMGGKGDSL